MSVTSSMWASVSGLLAHGEAMSVIGNNIANVNTVGFKGSRMDFMDYASMSVSSAGNGYAQVGRGVGVAAVMGDFSQGSYQSSNESTDIAISGKGFFAVSPYGSEERYYTRAGNFRFNNAYQLVDPNGYVVQGWEIKREKPSLLSANTQLSTSVSAVKGTGVPKDVALDGLICEPQHTTNITMNPNLSATAGNDKNLDPDDPFFSLLKHWNATNENGPLGSESYAYQESIKVYDESGVAHTITVYFDQVTDIDPKAQSLDNNNTAKRHWEFIVTMNPGEDNRNFELYNNKDGVYDGTVPDTYTVNPDFGVTDKSKGLLMCGTLTFDTGGSLLDMSAYIPGGNNIEKGQTGGIDLNDPSNWTPSPVSQNGFPMFVANFSGAPGATAFYHYDRTDPANVQIETNKSENLFPMELNFGLRNLQPGWPDYEDNPTITAKSVGKDVSNLLGVGTAKELLNSSAKSAAGPSSMTFMSQNGYTFGYLQNISVDSDGVLSGRYSNGQTVELYQLALYTFPSNQGLYREGGNLYSQTRESGEALLGPANANGNGSILSNSLEISNVDLATEFVNMITTQRGFQANSKTVTTVDSMLETVIGMKR